MPSQAKRGPFLWLLPTLPLLLAAAWFLGSKSERGTRADPTAEQAASPSTTWDESPLNKPEGAPDSQANPKREVQLPELESSSGLTPISPALAVPEKSLVRGQTLDVQGQAVPFVDLRFESSSKIVATSDASGHFELRRNPKTKDVTLVAFGKQFATVVGCRLRVDSAAKLQYVVVAPAINLAGKVLDEDQKPLAKVSISSSRWSAEKNGFPFSLDRGVQPTQPLASDAEGSFTYSSIPRIEGSIIEFRLAGYQNTTLPLPGYDQSDLRITLKQEALSAEIKGRVLLPDLSPAAGASVGFHGAQTKTDEWGNFELEFNRDQWSYREGQEPLAMAAALLPYGTAVLMDCAERINAESPDLPQDLELILGPKALSIRGRVINHEGSPLSGWKIRLKGELVLSHGGRMPARTAERLVNSRPVRSDSEGNFEIPGVLDREYELWAHDDRRMLSIQPLLGVRGGQEDVRLILGEDDFYPKLGGIVVDSAGNPMSAAKVSISLVTNRSKNGSSSNSSGVLITDKTGRFTLENIGKYEISVQVSGEELVTINYQVEEQYDPLAMRLVALRRCHFRLFIAGVGEEQQHVQFEDANGKPLSITSYSSNGSLSSSRVKVDPKKPGTRAVSEAAVALLVGLENPTRHAIQLIPGQVTELHIQQ